MVTGREGMAELAVLATPDAVHRAAEAWDDLSSASGAIGGRAWARAWLEAFGAGHALGIHVAGPPSAPDAVLPLVRSRSRPWVWEMLGVRQLGAPLDARGGAPAALG